MLELSYHNRNHFITTIIDGSIFTSNHMFGRAIWDKLPKCIFKNVENLKFSNISRVIYRKYFPNQKCGYWSITTNTLHRS